MRDTVKIMSHFSLETNTLEFNPYSLYQVTSQVRPITVLPFSNGSACSSTSPPDLNRDEPWLFFCFFFRERCAQTDRPD